MYSQYKTNLTMEYSVYVERLLYRHICSISLILYISKNTKLHLMCKTWSGDVGWSDDVGGLAHLPCWWVPIHASWLWRDSYAWCTVLSSDMPIHICIHRAGTKQYTHKHNKDWDRWCSVQHAMEHNAWSERQFQYSAKILYSLSVCMQRQITLVNR